MLIQQDLAVMKPRTPNLADDGIASCRPGLSLRAPRGVPEYPTNSSNPKTLNSAKEASQTTARLAQVVDPRATGATLLFCHGSAPPCRGGAAAPAQRRSDAPRSCSSHVGVQVEGLGVLGFELRVWALGGSELGVKVKGLCKGPVPCLRISSLLAHLQPLQEKGQPHPERLPPKQYNPCAPLTFKLVPKIASRATPSSKWPTAAPLPQLYKCPRQTPGSRSPSFQQASEDNPAKTQNLEGKALPKPNRRPTKIRQKPRRNEKCRPDKESTKRRVESQTPKTFTPKRPLNGLASRGDSGLRFRAVCGMYERRMRAVSTLLEDAKCMDTSRHCPEKVLSSLSLSVSRSLFTKGPCAT